MNISLEEYQELKKKSDYYDALVRWNVTGHPPYITECSHPKCNAFEVGNSRRDQSHYYNCKDIDWCEYCENYIPYCDKHLEYSCDKLIYCDSCERSYCDKHPCPGCSSSSNSSNCSIASRLISNLPQNPSDMLEPIDFDQLDEYLSQHGDCLPYPRVTKEELDRDMDEYWSQNTSKLKRGYRQVRY